MQKVLVTISGKHGAGKSTILWEVLKECTQFENIVAYTTRPRRPGEPDNYHFVDNETFDRLLREEKFVGEPMRVNSHQRSALAKADVLRPKFGITDAAPTVVERVRDFLRPSGTRVLSIGISAPSAARAIRVCRRQPELSVEQVTKMIHNDVVTDHDLCRVCDVLVHNSLENYVDAAVASVVDTIKRFLKEGGP